MIETRFSRFLAGKQYQLVISSVIAASLIIHTPAQFVQTWLLKSTSIPGAAAFNNTQFFFTLNIVRGLIFFLSIGFLLYTFVRPVTDFFSSRKGELQIGKIFQNSLVVFFITGILVIPVKLGIMGVGYGQMCIDPFNFYDATNQIYQRLLMPALAYFMQFKGPLLFYFFSLLVTFTLIFFTLLFFEVNNIRTTLLENISLAGTTYIITQFQSPGYTEQLSLLIALIVLIVPMGTLPKIAAVSLGLFAHEVSVLLFVAVAWLYFSKEEKTWVGLIILVYVVFWIMSFGFDLRELFVVRTVGGHSGIGWLAEHPLRELSGIAASYKLLWMAFGIALFRHSAELKRLILLIMPGLAATIFAVDTTRLMAFAFLAILLALVYVKKYALISERGLQLLFGINLCLPSIYIGLNSGLVYFDGLYQLLYRGYLFR
ncbi:MAG: hypothetical protein WBZ48_15105 [Bacteroidota bacterium]